MSLNNLSATNASGALFDAGDFVQNKRVVSNNQILYYTDLVSGVKCGFVWKGTLPHIISTNDPNTDGGISDTAWMPIIYSGLKEKLGSEGITLNWSAHLPTVEVAYGLQKNSLKVWKVGQLASSSDYWLYSDGTVWNGTGTLGNTPQSSSGFEQITPNFNASIKTYAITATDGQTTFNIPFTFSTINVFVNGSLQLPGINYTINGSSIVFSTELELGDDVYVFLGNPNISTNDKLNRIYTSVAMQGQTTLQVPYDFSTAIVYINGVLQNPSTAYSIGSDRIITFSEDLYEDDEIIVMLGDIIIQSDEYVLKPDLISNNTASYIGTENGKTLQTNLNNLYNKTHFVMPEDFDNYETDTEKLLAAIQYAKDNNIGSIELMPGKTYVLTGNIGLNIDLGYFSFGCSFGRAVIDATSFTGPYVVWAHSSVSYTVGYRNHNNTMKGLEIKGAIQGIGQALLLIGNNNNNSNGTYNGDCKIESCTFITADKVLLATNSTWRYKFINCGFTMGTAGTHIMHIPSGLADSGESISFDNCKIFDTKRCPILLECNNFSIGMSGTSVLNCPIQITGAGALIVMDSASNIENPGATAWYRYVSVSGAAARIVFDGSTVVCNQPSLQTQPLFEVKNNAFIEFDHVKMPGNRYLFYTSGVEGFNTFVEGDGYVNADATIADISSGVGNIPIHKSLNPTRNYNFATGTTSSWSFNNQGSPSQTIVVDPAYAKTGSYGARMTSYGTLSCYLSQNIKVTKHNYYTTSLLIRTISSSSTTTSGALTVTFYDRSGTAIQSGATANFSNTPGSWVSVGEFIQGRVPQSAEYAEISIRCRDGAVIDIDSIIINFS